MLGYSSTVISGSFPPAEREQRISGFREGRYQILLSSEVGSEGLDFQFCHILFNYDLPWNPMVVEQRIGRLDRFGQMAERILIFNLSAPGTIEDEILNRLYRRINLFESYIGDLEAILGGEITSLTKDLFDPDLSEGTTEGENRAGGRFAGEKEAAVRRVGTLQSSVYWPRRVLPPGGRPRPDARPLHQGLHILAGGAASRHNPVSDMDRIVQETTLPFGKRR
jgi:superfamily II DNA/RNA helicase